MPKGNESTEAKIVLVTNQKGGSGKTTSAVNLASGLHERGETVCLVDADPQNSVVSWFAAGEGQIPFSYANFAGAGKGIQNEIRKLVDKYTYIVIDGRPQLGIDIALLLIISDLVVLPLKPSVMDFHATEPLIREIEKAQTLNEQLKFTLMINQLMGAQRLLARACESAIRERGYPLMKTRIAYRECYPQAYAFGNTVFDNKDRAFKQAATEVRELTDEVISILQ
ncbi:AAA family ATPase [Burkholderia sp. 4701]|nr:AAA family ATPase [Burkholderia sp. 4701]MXN83612.1 AAA family ATPase [Burkholderia sp. 4812]